MEDVDLRHAKEHLEDLIARAARGEEVRIVDPKYGAVRLSAAGHRESDAPPLYPQRVPGLMKGKVHIADVDLLAPLTDDELKWLSGEESP
jgi:antitoxin (DNA-binding transcriptional repressor) of toxin-antitoxin stability system